MRTGNNRPARCLRTEAGQFYPSSALPQPLTAAVRERQAPGVGRRLPGPRILNTGASRAAKARWTLCCVLGELNPKPPPMWAELAFGSQCVVLSSVKSHSQSLLEVQPFRQVLDLLTHKPFYISLY